MNIAVVGPMHPYRGGIAQHTSFLAVELQRQHRVIVYSYRQQFPGWLYPGRTQLDPSPPPDAKVDTCYWLVPWWPPSWAKLRRQWVSDRPDVVIIQWWTPLMSLMTAGIAAAARRKSIPVVMICHNILPHEPTLMAATFARVGLGGAAAFVVHGTGEADALAQLLPGRRTLTFPMPRYAIFDANAWNAARARATLALSGRVLIFFGFVRPYKGLGDLLNALPSILADIDVTLLVVGEIWGSGTNYRALVERLGLDAHVRFEDRYVANEEAARYFAAADLAVFPYRSATGSAAVQLAFSFHVPVVATRTGSMTEAVKENVTGYLVEPGDVAGLAFAVKRFFREDRAAQMRASIAAEDPIYSWADFASSVVRFARADRVASNNSSNA